METDQWLYIGVDLLPTDHTILNLVLLQDSYKLL